MASPNPKLKEQFEKLPPGFRDNLDAKTMMIVTTMLPDIIEEIDKIDWEAAKKKEQYKLQWIQLKSEFDEQKKKYKNSQKLIKQLEEQNKKLKSQRDGAVTLFNEANKQLNDYHTTKANAYKLLQDKHKHQLADCNDRDLKMAEILEQQ
eukprot:205635_1